MITNPQEMGRQMLAEDPGAVPPGATEPTGAQSKRWVDQAEAKAAAGDRLGAIADLEQALTVEPNSLFVLRTLGSLLMEEEKHWEAKRRFQQLLDQQPEYLEGRVLSAIASLKMGRLDEFQSETERVLAIDPQQPDALRLKSITTLVRAVLPLASGLAKTEQQASKLKPCGADCRFDAAADTHSSQSAFYRSSPKLQPPP